MRHSVIQLCICILVVSICISTASPYGGQSLTSKHSTHHSSSQHHQHQHDDTAIATALKQQRCESLQDFNLEGEWVKHDRAVLEIFHINITCVENCMSMDACMQDDEMGLPSYQAMYLDGPLANYNTFNISMVGDFMSATGTYNNFADDSGSLACPAPFALIFEDDTNVVLVSYGATYGTICGDYTGDSARYYRRSALV